MVLVLPPDPAVETCRCGEAVAEPRLRWRRAAQERGRIALVPGWLLPLALMGRCAMSMLVSR